VNLVTGATGLLGSHVLIELAKRDKPIRAAYRSDTKKAAVEQLFHFYLKNLQNFFIIYSSMFLNYQDHHILYNV
jgi:nucleoside-diphosphate-sugar epimerase